MAFLVLTVLLLAAQAVQGDDNDVPLKKHVGFFDRNHDGIVKIPETIEGFKAIGVGTIKSATSAVLIHTALSSKTRPGGSFDLTFPIVIENIKFAKHTSDSDVYDNEGRFVPEKFEEIFTKHAHTNPNALTGAELDELLKANREPNDFKGWAAAAAEWKLLFDLGKDSNDLLQKETVREIFDGSLFFELEKKHSENK
uniref:Uncharacterized protein n=1 Tax=Kalanchoe fedtschenkoi TaxID=63787 RepID=A0A7N0TGQ7_KALFE